VARNYRKENPRVEVAEILKIQNRFKYCNFYQADSILDEAINALIAATPSMGSVYNVGVLARESFSAGGVDALRETLTKFLDYQVKAKERIAQFCRDFIKNSTVITISYSSVVYSALTTSKPKLVYVMESIPGGEGSTMCIDLKRVGIKCMLIPDLLIGFRLRDADLSLVGADMVAINPPRLVNKVGTLVLGVTAKYFEKPVKSPFRFSFHYNMIIGLIGNHNLFGFYFAY